VDARKVPAGGDVTLGVRPEHVQIVRDAGEGEGVQAIVALVEYLGDVTLVYAQVEGVRDMVAVKCDGDMALPAVGAKIGLVFPAARAYLFDEDGNVFAPAWAQAPAEELAGAR
jgi:multiple sugar transport system ATP-binding protein